MVDNSVWFTVQAIANGTGVISVTNINNNPGLAMEVYTGVCGSLATTGFCATGSSATAGAMSVSFPTVAGTTYYVMVDGEGGNQEAFDIVATTPDNAIVARPDPNFNTNPSYGCGPLNVILQNQTTLHGGSNITYSWKIDAGSYVTASGADTTLTLSTVGTHTITLRVCNTECGCKTVSQDVTVQDLYPSISYNPTSICPGTTVFFDGSAVILPDPPTIDPNVTDWTWDFGDPASGSSNSASGMNVSHDFTSTSSSYTVTLIADGICGPDTVTTTVNLLPKPLVDPGPDVVICEGADANLGITVTSSSPIVTVDWFGPGTFSCTNCNNPSVSGLTAGGPYTMFVSVTDSLGCTADTFVNVFVNELPIVDAGLPQQFCSYDITTLFANVSGGNPPYTYVWTPGQFLSDSTIDSPTAYNTDMTYCVTVTDNNGCVSSPGCVDLTHYPLPVIVPDSPTLCASASPLDNKFTVTGAAPGSLYEWGLSPDYAMITNAAPDSSDIDVQFPTGIVATYNFIVVVSDAVTGCQDTIPYSFDVTPGITVSVSGPASICNGDSATLIATGATTYAWTAVPAFAFADSTLDTQVVNPTVNTVFTVTGTTSGCTDTYNYILTVNPIPDANVSPITPVCGCSTVTLDGLASSPGMQYTWTSFGGNVIGNVNLPSTTCSICSTDTFNLHVFDTGSGCSADSQVVAVVLPNPNATATANPNLICNGVLTNILLDGTGSDTNPGTTYSWTSSPSVTINNSTTLNPDADVTTATTFTLTVTDAFGCDSSITTSVNIQPPPVISASPQFLCLADPNLTSLIDITGASPGSTYNWTAIPGCVVPNTTSASSQSFDFTTCGAGTYTFDVTVTDAVTTCVYNLSQDVNVVPSVNLVVSPPVAFCEGDSAQIYASGANTYLWSTTETTDTITVSGIPASATPYQYIVTGTVGTCTDTDTIDVTVNPVPATNPISGPVSICANDTTTYYSVTPFGGNYTWAVTGGTIYTGQGTDSILVHWTGPGLGSITVVDTNGFGCAGPVQSLSVTVNPYPTASTIFGSISVCEGSTSTYFVNPNAGSIYYWGVTGGNYAGGQIGAVNSFVWGAAGSGTVTVYEVNAAGCFGPTTTYNVTINPKPLIPAVTGTTLACDSVSEIYGLVANVGSTYTWTTQHAYSSTVYPTGDTIAVMWDTTGFGVLTVFETNVYGCNSDTLNFNVTINPRPHASILPDSISVCGNTSFQLTGSANVGTMHWFSDGNGTFSDTLSLTPTYTPAATDSGYYHLYMVLSNFPCADDTAMMTLYVSPAPVMTITSTQASICWGSSDTLTVSHNGLSLSWTPGGDTTSTIIVNPTSTTVYTATVTNQYGCVSQDSITVVVIPPGTPDAGPDLVFCVGDSIVLNGTQQNAGGIQWITAGDGVFDPVSNVSPVTYLPGTNDSLTGNVQIYLATTGACLNLTDTLNITIGQLPTLEAGPDTLLTGDAGETLALTPTVTNVTGVTWTTTGTGTFSPSDTSINATYTATAADIAAESVYLVITTSGGCLVLTDSLKVEFSPFVIPNVITPYPSSPGQNDYFVIKNIPPGTKLTIFNRWGLIVYKSESYRNNWDGSGLIADTYWYVINIEDKEYHGWIQLIRAGE